METWADSVGRRGQELYERRRTSLLERTDRLFARLLIGQWLFGIVLAFVLSPYAWAGRERSLHEHVYAATFLGAAIVSLPLVLVSARPGAAITRYVIAVAQMLCSALLIHLTGGRIETHFHVFGSLAFLAFYRDWKVLVPATVVVAGDHLVRQLLWPQSVYGIANPEVWRFLEHSFWVVFEDVFLVIGCLAASREMRTTSFQHAEVEALSERALAAKLQAENASLIKGQFLANMSHEIRTPLAGVIGVTELLAQTELTARQAQYVRTLTSSGNGLLAVINDVLDLSKIEAGKMELSTSDFRFRQVVEAVSELLSATAHAKGLALVQEISADVPACVAGDPDRLRQVLANLVSNAVKFTAKGRIEIHAALVAETEADVLIRVAVKDTGIGIAKENLGMLFRAFSQVDNSSTRKFGGTGLGLAISRQIVEMMGGEIGVESELGQGTTVWFTVRLEKRAYSVALSSWPAVRAAQAPRDARVLIADDNLVTQEVTRELLEALGYRADVVENGKQALAALAANDYAAVLMDCQMPEMTGYEAVEVLRRTEGPGKRTPVIAVTAHAMKGDRERGLASGMDDYLTKPLNRDELSGALLRWIQVPASSPAPAPAAPPGPAVRCSAQVAQLFLEDLPRRLGRMRDAVTLRDDAALRREAHSLRGSSLSIGAAALAAVCGEVESVPVEDLHRTHSRLEAEAESLRHSMLGDPRFALPSAAMANGGRS